VPKPVRAPNTPARMKHGVQSAVRRLGFDVLRRDRVPFGVRWVDDLSRLMGKRTGPTFIDVGAHIGETAQRLVQRFPDAAVYSFEPVPSTFAVLERNTSTFAGVQCVNIALGDVVGEATISTDRPGRNTLVPGISASTSATVPMKTLDVFCADNGIVQIDLLKIDTEGFEAPVLRGSLGLLSNGCVDFVLAECDFRRRIDEPHGDFFEIHDLLTKHGFLVVSFYVGGVDSSGWMWGDVLMMRQGCADQVPVISSPFMQ
jgi:FkbM family methyltransferase